MSLRPIPKHELRKIKQRVSKLRKQGHEVWTDEEVEKDGWTIEVTKTGSQSMAVKKVEQAESWDCGLACAQMVFGVLSDEVSPSQKALASRLAAPSVWTIDLAYLLADFGIECRYLTATADVDVAAYSKSDFYAASLDADARRVRLLFRAASDEGVQVEKRTLTAAELWNQMRDEDTLVIALVDQRVLYQRGSAVAAAAREGHFMGHYVLVLGLDDARGGYLINDPARADERTFVNADTLEAARHADGTDDDLLLIPIDQPPPVAPDTGSTPAIARVLRERVETTGESIRGVEGSSGDGGEEGGEAAAASLATPAVAPAAKHAASAKETASTKAAAGKRKGGGGRRGGAPSAESPRAVEDSIR